MSKRRSMTAEDEIDYVLLLIALFMAVVCAVISESASAQTTALLPNGMQQFSDANGAPYAAGKVYFYIPNTTTTKTTWQDSASSVANANPVILDAAGRATIWGQGTYREVLQDQFGNAVWDKLTSAGGSTSSLYYISNIASLGQLSTVTASTVQVLGYYAPGDGGGGIYTATNAPCVLNPPTGDGGSQIQSSNGNCWQLAAQTTYDIRQWGAVAICATGLTANCGTDPNGNNAALINNAEAFCNSVGSGSRPVAGIKISGGMRGYGTNAPVTLACEGQLFGEMTLVAQSATSLPCTTTAMVQVTNPSFVITVRDLEIDSNFLPVNGLANETNGEMHFENMLIHRWSGSCQTVPLNVTAGGNRHQVTVGSTASLVAGMVSRGNQNIGGAANGILDRSVIMDVVDATHIIIDKPTTGTGFTSAAANFYTDANGAVWGLNNTNAGGGIYNANINEYEASDTTQCGGNCTNQNAYRFGAAFLMIGASNDVAMDSVEMDQGVANVMMFGGSGLQAHRLELNAGSFATPETYVSNVLIGQGSTDLQIDQFSNNGGAINYFTVDSNTPRLRLTGMLTQTNTNAQLDPAYWVHFWTNQTGVSISKIILDPPVINNNNALGYYLYDQSAGSYTTFGPSLQYNSGVAQAMYTNQQTFVGGTGNFTFTAQADGATNLLTSVANGSGCSGSNAPWSCMTAGDQVVIASTNYYIVSWDQNLAQVTLSSSPPSAGGITGSDVPCNHTFLPQDSQTNFFFDVHGQACGPYFSTILPKGWQLGGLVYTDTAGGGSLTLNGQGVSLLYAGSSTSSITATIRQYYQGAIVGTSVLALH